MYVCANLVTEALITHGNNTDSVIILVCCHNCTLSVEKLNTPNNYNFGLAPSSFSIYNLRCDAKNVNYKSNN